MKLRVLLRSGCIAIVLGMLCNAVVYGQVRDAGLWTSLTFEAKLVKKLSVAFSQEYQV